MCHVSDQPTLGLSRTERPHRDVLALGTAGLISGLTAYGFVVVTVRVFGAQAVAPVTVLWSLWAVATAGVSYPLQHWIIRTITIVGSERSIRMRSLPLVSVVLVVACLAGSAAWGARMALFGSPSALYPILTGAVVATSGLWGYVRGVLGGRGRFLAMSLTVATDGAFRLLLLLLAVVFGLKIEAVAMAIPAGSLVAVAWLSTFRLSPIGPRDGLTSPRNGSLVGAFLLLHTMLNAPPIFAAAMGASSESVTSLFAAVTVFRAPFLIVSVVATRITYVLSRSVEQERWDTLNSFRHWVLAMTALAMIIGGLSGMALGQGVLQFLFGTEIMVSPLNGFSIAAASLASIGVLLLVLLLASRGRASSTHLPLLAGVVAGAMWTLVPLGTVATQAGGGFLVSIGVSLLALCFTDWRVSSGGVRTIRWRVRFVEREEEST